MSDAYRCNDCDSMFGGKSKFIAHYRKEHPESAYGLWDAIGTLGDKFSDSAMNAMEERRKMDAEQAARLEEKAKAYDALVPRFNVLARKLQIIALTVEGEGK